MTDKPKNEEKQDASSVLESFNATIEQGDQPMFEQQESEQTFDTPQPDYMNTNQSDDARDPIQEPGHANLDEHYEDEVIEKSAKKKGGIAGVVIIAVAAVVGAGVFFLDNKHSDQIIQQAQQEAGTNQAGADDLPTNEPSLVASKNVSEGKSIQLDEIIGSVDPVYPDPLPRLTPPKSEQETPLDISKADLKLVEISVDKQISRIDALTEKQSLIDGTVTRIDQQMPEIQTQLAALQETLYKLVNDKKLEGKPPIKLIGFSTTSFCQSCTPHSIIEHQGTQMIIANGDTFKGYTAKVIADRLILSNNKEQYSYYPEK